LDDIDCIAAVIPAKAGIQCLAADQLDPGLRRDDE